MKRQISKRIMKRLAMLLIPVLTVGALTVAAQADDRAAEPNATLLVTGVEELQGSAVGPGGALFVTAPLAGSIWRGERSHARILRTVPGERVLPRRRPPPRPVPLVLAGVREE